jgi:hypothetical protein
LGPSAEATHVPTAHHCRRKRTTLIDALHISWLIATTLVVVA